MAGSKCKSGKGKSMKTNSKGGGAKATPKPAKGGKFGGKKPKY